MRAFDAQVTMWNEKPEILIIIVLVIIFKNLKCNPSRTKKVYECNHTRL
jgi:hypothetical protein